MVRRFAAVLMGATALIGMLAAPSLAQCSEEATLEEAVARANTVFVGTVVGLSNSDRTAEVEVLGVWKGSDLPPQTVVVGGSDDPTVVNEDDRTFNLGVTYLFVLADFRPPFSDDICSATRPYEGSPTIVPGNLRDDVGATIGRTPVSDETSRRNRDEGGSLRPVVALIGSIAVIMLAIVLIQAVSRYRPAPGAPPLGGSDTEGEASARGVREPVGPMFGRTGEEEMARLRKEDRKRRRKQGDERPEEEEGDVADGAEEVDELPEGEAAEEAAAAPEEAEVAAADMPEEQMEDSSAEAPQPTEDRSEAVTDTGAPDAVSSSSDGEGSEAKRGRRRRRRSRREK